MDILYGCVKKHISEEERTLFQSSERPLVQAYVDRLTQKITGVDPNVDISLDCNYMMSVTIKHRTRDLHIIIGAHVCRPYKKESHFEVCVTRREKTPQGTWRKSERHPLTDEEALRTDDIVLDMLRDTSNTFVDLGKAKPFVVSDKVNITKPEFLAVVYLDRLRVDTLKNMGRVHGCREREVNHITTRDDPNYYYLASFVYRGENTKRGRLVLVMFNGDGFVPAKKNLMGGCVTPSGKLIENTTGRPLSLQDLTTADRDLLVQVTQAV